MKVALFFVLVAGSYALQYIDDFTVQGKIRNIMEMYWLLSTGAFHNSYLKFADASISSYRIQSGIILCKDVALDLGVHLSLYLGLILIQAKIMSCLILFCGMATPVRLQQIWSFILTPLSCCVQMQLLQLNSWPWRRLELWKQRLMSQKLRSVFSLDLMANPSISQPSDRFRLIQSKVISLYRDKVLHKGMW